MLPVRLLELALLATPWGLAYLGSRPCMLDPSTMHSLRAGALSSTLPVHTPCRLSAYTTNIQLTCPPCPCCSTSYIECLNGTSGKWALREGLLGNISTPDGTFVPAVYNAYSTPGGKS